MMDFATARHIVLKAPELKIVPSPDIDSALEDVGLVSANLRLVFRENIRLAVHHAGFRISRAKIPYEADTTLRQVVEAVLAFSLPGDPTTTDPNV